MHALTARPSRFRYIEHNGAFYSAKNSGNLGYYYYYYYYYYCYYRQFRMLQLVLSH